MSEGYEKAREVADKIKADLAEKQEKVEEGKQVALSQLSELSKNSELMKMYTENASLGADNLGGELPLLKIHAVGKSSTNQLQDGTEPEDGWFFYKPEKRQYESIQCHILTISKGFKSPGIEEGKEVFNQILAGVLIDEGNLKPFVMYFTGLKLSYLWELAKELGKYNRAKPVPIPVFALTVNLTTEKITNNYGKSWIVKFEIEKFQDGSPKLVMDVGEFRFLRDMVTEVENTISTLISNKTIKGAMDEPARPIQEIEADRDEVNPEDIPF